MAIRETFLAQTGNVNITTLYTTSLMQSSNFSANINIPFCTPEEFFLGESPQQFVRKFDPTTYASEDGSLAGEIGESLCCTDIPNVQSSADPRRLCGVLQEIPFRHRTVVWQPRCGQVDILLDFTAATGLRTR